MKILVLVNAHALAHVSRPLEVSRHLAARGHQIAFAGHGQFLGVAREAGFEVFALPYLSVETLAEAVHNQRLWKLFPAPEVARYIEAERALYERYQPDLVLLDNRVTARTSAELHDIPAVAIQNVHMSTYKAIPFASLRNGRPGKAGLVTRLLDRLVNAVECFFYDRVVLGGLNRVRRRLGLPRLYSYDHEGGDLVLHPDIPELNPVRRMPAHARYVGPLTWRSGLPLPAGLARRDRARKLIYFTLGSVGLESWLQEMARLADSGMDFVVATGDVALPEGLQVPANVMLERFVDADAVLPLCDAVVCHGGNGTLYQALAHGVPIVGVATHEEQLYGLKRIRRLGAGVGVHVRELEGRGLNAVLQMLRQVCADSSYRDRAQQLQRRLWRWDGPRAAAALIEAFAANLQRDPEAGALEEVWPDIDSRAA